MADLSRREMLKRVVVAGAAASLPVARPSMAAVQTPAGMFETLTTGEGATLQAVVARLIPSDERGPGALEAGAATYIDRALAGPLAGSREAYRAGLAALDRYARSAKGERFAALEAADQEVLLRNVEANAAPEFGPGAAGFFNLLLTHTIQGTFSDPAHGGNVDFIGWRMLGYPGVRTVVTPDLQRIDRLPPARQVSAYDFPAFSAARERRTRGR
ncbi:MAG: gluconate 2-dehydrogenase subunit 3 family protein [Acidobacteria bacterium]|nr:gluconate 2-dehydrogenase subunit 3 family protein [Acidobacteriota bacterium]